MRQSWHLLQWRDGKWSVLLHAAGSLGKTIDSTGLVVNLKQVHLSTFSPVSERVCVYARAPVWLIGFLSACATGKQKKEPMTVQASEKIEMCVREYVCGVTRFSKFNSIEWECWHCNQSERWSHPHFCNIRLMKMMAFLDLMHRVL